MEVTVIVLGDLARSPRMLNHVSSLLSHNFKVLLIGYQDSVLSEDLLTSKNLKINSLSSAFLSKFKQLSGKLFIIYAFLRLFFESLQLFYFLIRGYRSKVVLVQNPPSMPVLLVAYFATALTGASLIVDWHNYAWSLLKIANKSKAIVNIALFYERALGRLADGGFCVSQNMEKDLESLGIKTRVLYDRPKEMKNSGKDMRKFFGIGEEYFFIVSSTSWTIDEDFSIVLDAMDQISQTDHKIFLIITGKGPLKDFYKSQIQQKNWKNIRVEMPWLEIEDYPAVLSQADLGICLHISSSGLDLPMKIVDMQSCQLPSLAFNYPTISEFVNPGINGDLFSTSSELSSKILSLKSNPSTLSSYRSNLSKFKQLHSWQSEWNHVALPSLTSARPLHLRSFLIWTLVALGSYFAISALI